MIRTLRRELNRGLVLDMPLSEGSDINAFDRSSKQNNGIITNPGDTSWVADRLAIGKALYFGGTNGHIIVPQSTTLQWEGSFTTAFWMKIANHEPQYMLISKAAGVDWYIQELGDGKIELALNGQSSTSYSYTQVNNIQDNVWAHVTSVYDCTVPETKIYIDAVDKQIGVTGTMDTEINGTLALMYIGVFGGSFWLDGTLQDLRIWTRPLPQYQVLANYERRRRM